MLEPVKTSMKRRQPENKSWPDSDLALHEAPNLNEGGERPVKPEEVSQLERFLKKRFNMDAIEVRQTPRINDTAEVYIGDEMIAELLRDEDEGELSYYFEMNFDAPSGDAGQLQSYLNKRFNMETIEVRQRPQKKDSDEVYIGDEFIAVLYRENTGGKPSYHFEMSILDFDLQEI